MVGLMRDALMSCPADVEVPTLIDIKVDGVARRHILTPIPKLALERALAVYMRERPTGSPQEFLSMCEGLTGERGSVQYRTVARMSL